ncbi:MAG: WG repeat-containing protein, partial [Flavobacteriales bacterium]
IPIQNSDAGQATGALIPFKKKTKWGFADRTGKVVINEKYDQAWEMVVGLARVKNGSYFGAIDSTGQPVIELQYTDLLDPKDGYLVARSDSGTGLLDMLGAVKVPLNFDEVELVQSRIARVERNERFAYFSINEKKFIWKQAGFDEAENSAE